MNLCPDQSALVEHETRVKQNNRADEGGLGALKAHKKKTRIHGKFNGYSKCQSRNDCLSYRTEEEKK